MKFTAEQISEILEGEIVGNPNAEVYTFSKIEDAKTGSVTFLSNSKYNFHL
jgi:UDP-3-O-[3-hydroxymyristoyl] glucosamine N-acyltransferase